MPTARQRDMIFRSGLSKRFFMVAEKTLFDGSVQLLIKDSDTKDGAVQAGDAVVNDYHNYKVYDTQQKQLVANIGGV